MSTAIRSSAMFAVLALTIVGATAAQAQGFVPYGTGANAHHAQWMKSHPIVSTSRAPTVANDVPSVVYPFRERRGFLLLAHKRKPRLSRNGPMTASTAF